jgi:hypothetical protein
VCVKRFNSRLFVFVFFIFLFTGCLAGPTRVVFCSKVKTDTTSYLTADKIPMRIDIPGCNWRYLSKKSAKHIMLETDDGPKRFINIFEYSDGILFPRFFKSGFTDAQAIEAHYQWESTWQMTYRKGFVTSKIIAKDVDGPIIPNILWSLDLGKYNSPTYGIVMGKNRHLIMLTLEVDPPYSGEKGLLEIFRQIQLLTEEKVYEVIRTESDLNLNMLP